MKIGNRTFDTEHKAYIMGILNVTPDSFSDGGKYNRQDEALFHVEQMIKEGADIIDVGGESTRPGYTLISDEEEMERVLPVVERIKERFDTVISLDTYKSKVALAGVRTGIDLVNDIWGLTWDGTMAETLAKEEVAICVMHNRKEAVYQNFLQDVKQDLTQMVTIAKNAGISFERLMIDPGIGFAKTKEQNLELLNHLEELSSLQLPILLGTSRKSVIGLTLNLPVTEREEGTMATTAIGVMKGCRFFRVHDVAKNRRVADMAMGIVLEGK